MKTATISARPARDPYAYAWTWQCAADKTGSRTSFAFYYECLTDAREHGYEVEPSRPIGMMAPGGPRYALPGRGERP